MNDFFDLQKWIDRVKSETPFNRVEGLVEFSAPVMDLQRLPAVFVVLPDESGEETEQLFRNYRHDFSVLIANSFAGDLTGVKANNKMRTELGLLKDSLNGWDPFEGCKSKLLWTRTSNLALLDDGIIIHKMDFVLNRTGSTYE